MEIVTMPRLDNAPLLRKLLANAKPMANGCLEWTGFRGPTGYGQIYDGVRSMNAHRVMYRVKFGDIPRGIQVLHSCDNPPCILPAHLSLGTGKKNMQESVERGRHHEAVKTHCDHGHELVGENLYVAKNGTRHCKVCSRIRQRIDNGWPEDLARSAPKGYTGQIPGGLVRVKPPARRPHGAPHCSKGHELAGKNRYVTPQGNVECRTCRQIARARYARNYQAKTSQSDRGTAK